MINYLKYNQKQGIRGLSKRKADRIRASIFYFFVWQWNF